MAKTEKDTMSLEEVQAQVAAILAQAKAEAAKIVEEAKAATGGKKAGMSAEERAAHEAYMNELVEVKLFKDNGKYKDDLVVGVNGELIVIQRGERVKVKRKYAEVLDNSDKQDYETSKLIEQKTGEWSKTGL